MSSFHTHPRTKTSLFVRSRKRSRRRGFACGTTFELRIGSSLRRTIDRGIARSRFGVVVLSESFLEKGWPGYELDGLVTRAVSGEQVLLPIWPGVAKQQVMDYSPSLADKLARSTATHTVTEIAADIAAVVQQHVIV